MANLDFSPNVNCLVGANGMGKSNVLDAIYYLSFCRGFVLIGKKPGEMELFDCRNGERKPILSKMELDKVNCRLLDIRPRYDNENLVAVIMQKKDKQGFSGKKLYTYDLKNNYLFLREN